MNATELTNTILSQYLPVGSVHRHTRAVVVGHRGVCVEVERPGEGAAYPVRQLWTANEVGVDAQRTPELFAAARAGNVIEPCFASPASAWDGPRVAE